MITLVLCLFMSSILFYHLHPLTLIRFIPTRVTCTKLQFTSLYFQVTYLYSLFYIIYFIGHRGLFIAHTVLLLICTSSLIDYVLNTLYSTMYLQGQYVYLSNQCFGKLSGCNKCIKRCSATKILHITVDRIFVKKCFEH